MIYKCSKPWDRNTLSTENFEGSGFIHVDVVRIKIRLALVCKRRSARFPREQSTEVDDSYWQRRGLMKDRETCDVCVIFVKTQVLVL